MTPSRRCSRWDAASIAESPQAEVAELARIYESKGFGTLIGAAGI